ncbi:replication-associated recombination protein A [Aliifodinibius sp. S!AR15-10]|uniref:replication-associated recombination protein A n=1 Tax=Aliifodinibius sp. S!AR15-10 TaxID=2950437 RepID=UPI00285C8015|nr:replication-associated recombination protein A [Aliifodinibius sp. S!AR15-10]MDR8389661.1 replication-associated recombination protein A [Aliifodinibius sp. S!AR15-10]
MNLFEEEKETSPDTGKKQSVVNPHEPLATRMRPHSLDEFVGQDHIVGEGKMLRRMIESGVIGSLIFYGPPSSGKTTLAHVISREINAKFEVLNAVLDGIKDLRQVVEHAQKIQQMNGKKTILFVDEIHRWNKAQQDALLPHLESGVITLIGATTENPYYSLVNPLLSRCQLFELYDLQVKHVKTMIDRALTDKERGLGNKKVVVTDDAKNHLADYAGGDIRNALNALEVAVLSSDRDEEGKIHIDLEIAKECIQKRNVRYQGTGDEHYHYASAFIKSMRGSDPDAALYWMVSMLEGGDDPNFIFRRMLILASEDVGMADPHALSMVNSAHEAFTKCGMPEGMYFLAHACIYLSLAPKSNSTGAIFSVQSEIKNRGTKGVPPHLKDKTANSKEARYLDKKNASDDYRYPHSYSNNWTEQQYLPDDLEGSGWYEPGNIGREGKLWQRLEKIREKVREDRRGGKQDREG